MFLFPEKKNTVNLIVSSRRCDDDVISGTGDCLIDRFCKRSTNLDLELVELIEKLRKRWEKEKTKEHFLYLIGVYLYLVKHSTWLVFPGRNIL